MKRYLIVLIALLGINNVIKGQNQNVYQINTISEQSNFKTNNRDQVLYDLNTKLFEEDVIKKGSLIKVSVPRGNEVLQITRVTEFIKGIKSYRGESEAGKIFSFTYHNGYINGIFHESHSETVFFRVNKKLKKGYLSTHQEEELNCLLELSDSSYIGNVHTLESFSEKKKEQQGGIFSNNELSENTTIDVLVAYTKNAKSWAFLNSDYGDIEAEIAQAFNLSQTALDNSNIPVTLRVVYLHEVDYNELFDGKSSGERLRLMTASPNFNPFGIEDGEMDELHTLRDLYGADLVTLMAQVDDTGGIAWRLSNRYGSPTFGFSLNRVQQITSGYTLVHELGHNMGNSHSRTQTVQQATILGGVFQESVGYQDYIQGIHTIMAYSAEGLDQVPVFSSPDINFQNSVAGKDEPTDITDAALSIKKIKNVIASYRKTKTSAPIPEINSNSITVDLNREEVFEVPLKIQNSGESNLDYSVDFIPTDKTIPDAQKVILSDSLLADTLLYTGFEEGDDFSTFNYTAANFWRIFASENTSFSISNDSAKKGSNHLRLQGDDIGTPKFLYAPYLGALTYGSYKVSFYISVPDLPNISEDQFSFAIYDGKTIAISSGLIIDGGEFFIRTLNESGNEQYLNTNISPNFGSYDKIEIVYDGSLSEIQYLINGVEVDRVDFQESGNTPSEMIVVHSNNFPENYIDIDEYSVVKFGNPYNWLLVDKPYGSVKPGESENISLSFNTKDVSSDTYFGQMIITTNNEGDNSFEIPIQLNVSNIVSNEDENFNPQQFTLSQNYPNPFNPTTNISFNLPQASEVNLKVYNMLGQEVATLVNERLAAGAQTVTFDASNLASGMYIYRIQASGYVKTKKMMLIK